MKSLEQYSKQEILNAIYYKQRFDTGIVPALEAILARTETDKALREWELAVKISQEALEEWIAVQKEINFAHGGSYKLTELTPGELARLSKAAEKAQITEKTEQKAYAHLEEVQNAQLKQRKK